MSCENTDHAPLKLNDISEAIVDCEHKTAPVQDKGIPSIRTNNINNGYLDLDGANKISEETYLAWTKRLEPKPNDIILAREAPVGEVGIVPAGKRVCLGQRTVLIRPNPKLVDPHYLLYLLLTRKMKHQLASRAEGSTVSHLNMSEIRKLDIPELPPLTEQKKISSILRYLDEKLEVNRQMNTTLEHMAQAIFKQWFIDFEFPDENGQPYRSSGGEMVDSELGEIPAGWEVKPIGDICKTVGGGTPKTKEPSYWENGEIFWATPTDMTSLKSPIIFDTSRKITEKGLKNSSAKMLPLGSILMTSRATLGYFAITQVPICTNQGFISMICDGDVSNYYMLNAIKNKVDLIENLASGSTYLEINKTSFRSINIIVPTKEVSENFDEIAKLIYQKIYLNELESQNLSKTRDELLPKLMSGKIRVNS